MAKLALAMLVKVLEFSLCFPVSCFTPPSGREIEETDTMKTLQYLVIQFSSLTCSLTSYNIRANFTPGNCVPSSQVNSSPVVFKFHNTPPHFENLV